MEKLTLVYPPSGPPTRPPIGLACLKAFVEKNSGIRVRCLDLNIKYHRHFIGKREFFSSGDFFRDYFRANKRFFSYFKEIYGKTNRAVRQLYKKNPLDIPFIRECFDKIRSTRPDVVGFSIVFNQQFFYACALAKLIREELNIPVVFGGGAVSGHADKYKDFGAEVISGEGEQKLLERLCGVRGTKSGPPDYSDFDHSEYITPQQVLPIQSSRGCCWGKCTFCTHHKNFSGYQKRAVDDVIREIKIHYENGIRHLSFVDDTIPAKRAEEMADSIIGSGMKISYLFETRPTKDFSSTTLKRLYDSGCRIILWGFESGCQETLDAMKKGFTVEEAAETLKRSHAAGIKNFVFIMHGFPTEDEDGFKKTIRFLETNRESIDFISKAEFGLQKGSPVFSDPEKYGITEIKKEEREFLPPGYSFRNPKRIKSFGKYDMIINELNRRHFHQHYFSDHMLVFYGA